MKNLIPRYTFYKNKYGSELLIDVVELKYVKKFLSQSSVHTLTYYDITFVTEGEGKFSIDNQTNEAASRDVFFSKPGEIRNWDTRHIVNGYADQYLVSDHHRYSQSDGSDRIGFFGCRREDYSVCHAASDGNLIGSSDDDGTELRSRTYTTDEPLSGFGDRNCTCFRCIGLCVFTIPAGNAYRVLYQRCCGGINGGGVSAGI